jgi:RNA polymerase sigma factor (sigma-70 family)
MVTWGEACMSTPTTSSIEGSSRVRRDVAFQTTLDELIVRARSGDGIALDQLIEKLSEQLWVELEARRRSNRTGPAQGSSDLVQDTLMRVRQQFHRFERNTFADFKQWARTILYRRRQEWIRNHLSRNSDRHKRIIWDAIRARPNHGGTSSDGALSVEDREEAERAYQRFQALKPHEQFVIDLRLFQDLTYKQIAAMTQSTEDACRQAYNRALARLKSALDAHEQA